jgi:NTE family protein
MFKDTFGNLMNPYHPGASHGKIASLLLLACILTMAATAAAEEISTTKTRPRIGLVLSGGGARGLAHVGVIQVLEEMKIPIDYVAGTSMGAIVGAFYASGISPSEIEKIIVSMEWNEAFIDKPPPSDLPFRRKRDAADFLINFDLGFKDGRFTLPKGLLQGQNLNLMLKSMLIHTEDIKDFDKLNIPFRAVATDIETGNAVILGKGELVKSLRASMSIPAMFAPLEIEGKMLVDGGMANNLPVDVVRKMGADIVIAVDISTTLSNREKLTTSIEITSQLTSIMVQRNTAYQISTLTGDDILIQPDLGSIKTGEFFRAEEAVAVGRKKAASMNNLLARLGNEQAFLAFLQTHRKKELPPMDIDEVQIANKSSLPTDLIDAHVDVKPGSKFNMRELKRTISQIYGIDMFESVDFFLRKKDKSSAIVIEPLEKSWGPNYFRFGLGLEDNFKGTSSYGLTVQFTKTAINSRGGEWRNELRIGESPRFFTEFYQPIDYGMRYFVAASAQYYVRNINDYSDAGDILKQYRTNAFLGELDIGRELGNWGEIRAGLRREHGIVKVLIGDPTVGEDPYDRGSVFASLAYSTLDNYIFPLKGSDASLVWDYNIKALGSDIEVQSLGFRWMTALTFGKYTFMPGVSFQTTIDNDDAEVQDTFPLGGFLNLSGYSTNEIYGRHTGLARLIFYRELTSAGIGAFKMPVYFGVSGEAGNVWNKRSDINFESLIYAGSIFLGTKTYLGPIYLAYGQAQRGHSSFYLYLGQRF